MVDFVLCSAHLFDECIDFILEVDSDASIDFLPGMCEFLLHWHVLAVVLFLFIILSEGNGDACV